MSEEQLPENQPTDSTLMEVHHHSRHKEHGKKKWIEYFFEFFMLFLAVMAGFFAENYREHYIERHREDQLAVSLHNDIQKDTANLNFVLNFSKLKIAHLDTAVMMLKNYPEGWDDTAFYRNITPLIRAQTFQRSGATFEQVKSSGFLRYFDQPMVDMFNEYDLIAKKIREREEIETTTAVGMIIPYMSDIINMEVAYDVFSGLPVTHELYLNNFDKPTIQKIINFCVLSKRGRDRSIAEYTMLLENAEKTLDKMEKEYHLE